MIELTETASKALLGPGVRLPAEVVTHDLDVAIAFVESDAGRKVVAKASGVAHKTEGKLVRLDLDADGLRASFAELAAAGDGNVVVVEMVPTDVEMIVGAVRDPVFGPVVTIGAGGIGAEAAPDVVAVLAPPEPGEVESAVETLRMAPLLAWVGEVALRLDLVAFGELVDAVAGVFEDPAVVAVDVNPVSVVDGRPVVLDALVVVDEASVS